MRIQLILGSKNYFYSLFFYVHYLFYFTSFFLINFEYNNLYIFLKITYNVAFDSLNKY